MAAILMTSLLGPDAELRWANWLKLLQISQSLILYRSPKIVTKFTWDHFFGPFDIDYKALINKLLSVNWYFLSISCVVVDSLLIVTPIVGFCNCSLFCCVILCLHSSFAIISMGKREQFALLCLSSCVALPRGAMGLSAVCDWCIF